MKPRLGQEDRIAFAIIANLCILYQIYVDWDVTSVLDMIQMFTTPYAVLLVILEILGRRLYLVDDTEI